MSRTSVPSENTPASHPETYFLYDVKAIILASRIQRLARGLGRIAFFMLFFSFGQLRGLLFHPIVEPPEFVNDYQRGEWTFAARRVENALHCFVAALVRDGLPSAAQAEVAASIRASARITIRIRSLFISLFFIIEQRIFLAKRRRNYK